MFSYAIVVDKRRQTYTSLDMKQLPWLQLWNMAMYSL